MKNPFRLIYNRLQRSLGFRIWYAKLYGFMKKSGMLKLMKSLEPKGSGDPWAQSKQAVEEFELNQEGFSFNPMKLVERRENLKIGFLIDPRGGDLRNITVVCNAMKVKFRIFSILNPELYKELKEPGCDGLMVMPDHRDYFTRNLFHEAVQVITSECDLPIYPSLAELNFYEAKRTLANYMVINDIPHPNTSIFYDLPTAVAFLEKARYPLVFKTHIGASSSGVEILYNKKSAMKLASRLFNKYYLQKGDPEYRSMDWGYMLLQEFIVDVKEHRVIKIGNSWFGYQKWKEEHQEFMSGSGVQKWTPPSSQLLDFCNKLAVKYNFTTLAFDIFEDQEGRFLVNEMQTRFGSYDPSEMYVNGKPGRYFRKGTSWEFEEGFFNVHGSMFLIIADFIDNVQKSINR